jgi:hypothetical protein
VSGNKRAPYPSHDARPPEEPTTPLPPSRRPSRPPSRRPSRRPSRPPSPPSHFSLYGASLKISGAM